MIATSMTRQNFNGHSGRVGMAARRGPPHGPEWRAHLRDRTPRPLEAGRRYGGPLHPRRVRRVGAAVFIIDDKPRH